MKQTVVMLLLLFTSLLAQNKTIYSFRTTNNKTVQFLYNETDSIFTYQFISKGKVELEIIDDLKDQDTIFTVTGYYRGGGCRNAAMSWNEVTFSNGDYNYKVYHYWSVDEESCEKDPDNPMDVPPSYGVTVTRDGEDIADIKGTEVLIGEAWGWAFTDILPQQN